MQVRITPFIRNELLHDTKSFLKEPEMTSQKPRKHRKPLCLPYYAEFKQYSKVYYFISSIFPFTPVGFKQFRQKT